MGYIKVFISKSFWSFQLFHAVKRLDVFYADPADIYLLNVNNKNTRTRCEICSMLTMKTPERRH